MRKLYNPSLDEVFGDGSALGINHQYVGLAGDNWSEADAYAATETALLEQFAGDPYQIEEVRDEEIENGDFPDEVYPLDLGVASLVHFVSAAGMVPISSCNGLAGHHESIAIVVLTCDPPRLHILQDIVAESPCDLFFEGYGDGNLVIVQSDDWSDLRALGWKVSRAREAFDRCPPPLTFSDFEDGADPETPYYPMAQGRCRRRVGTLLSPSLEGK